MSVNVYELYQQTVLPLPERARLTLATLILQDISHSEKKTPLTEEEAQLAEARFARWIGAGNSGDPNSADNERIDADLAREYGATHDDEE